MTRVTAPINKLARSLASHPSVARPAYLVAGGARFQHNAAAGSRAELSERDDTSSRRFTMAHRPTPSPVPSPNRVVPLMQTFSTTTPKAARLDTSTIDYAVMPSLADEAGAGADLSLRVPLLPDNFFPARDNIDGHHPEVADGPLANPQIVVVAAHPDLVAPASALTEIEGMGVDGVELKFAHLGGSGAAGAASAGAAESESGGMIRDLWKGLLEDLTASPTTTTHKSA